MHRLLLIQTLEDSNYLELQYNLLDDDFHQYRKTPQDKVLLSCMLSLGGRSLLLNMRKVFCLQFHQNRKSLNRIYVNALRGKLMKDMDYVKPNDSMDAGGEGTIMKRQAIDLLRSFSCISFEMVSIYVWRSIFYRSGIEYQRRQLSLLDKSCNIEFNFSARTAHHEKVQS
jgi:hypothetical protein